MRDMCHCRFDYDASEDEFAPFYDFTKSYHGIPGGDEDMPDKAAAVSTSGLSLLFTDGKVAGHRALSVYFKQRPRVEVMSVAEQCSLKHQQELEGAGDAPQVQKKKLKKKKKKTKVQAPFADQTSKHVNTHKLDVGMRQNKTVLQGPKR
eukprot:TRINITY_DN27289_c0_g1_i1.p1 TRINITY_DN27289_c0_g1~~TRINITY_DN27289_c0_g1_i1.p1  ORF type:complete len:164 (-),score=64.67 TRINITY_DN27289_c0_g1_i1:77-523(-)